MTTVFVTGGGGFVGSYLVRALEGHGAEVVAPKRADLDLTDVDAVAGALQQSGASVLVHLASCLDRREEPGAQDAQWRDTFATGRCVLYAAAKAELPLAVMAGSMDEVGTAQGVVAPDVVAAPTTTYGLCKALTLDVARFLAARGGPQVEWFRPTAIYGPHQQGPMLIPSAFRLAAGGGHSDFTSGEQERDFIYVEDVVDWVVRATQLTPTGGVRVHHVGSGQTVAVREVLSRIAALSGADFRLGALPRRPGEPMLMGVPRFTDERAPLDGWTARTSLSDGLTATWGAWQ